MLRPNCCRSYDRISQEIKKSKKPSDAFVSPDAVSVCANANIFDVKFKKAAKIRYVVSGKANKIINRIKALQSKNHITEKDMARDDVKIRALCEEIDNQAAECNGIMHEFSSHEEEMKSSSSVYGGETSTAIKDSINNCGICLQNVFNQTDNKLLKEFDSDLKSYSQNEKILKTLDCDPSSILDHSTHKMLMKIIRRLQRDKLKEHPALLLFKKKCKNSQDANEMATKANTRQLPTDPSEAISKISVLLSKNMPVGIGYDDYFLQGIDGVGGHASSIVGKKNKDEKVYFIVRNSWGKNTCERLLEQNPSSPFTCDNGDFLVEANLLVKKTNEITIIE